MKIEDIDKKIGMPDVDKEWAKFECEVINPKTTSRKPLYWSIGIAASIALVAGIFLFSHDAEEPQHTVAQQTTPSMQMPSEEKTAIEVPIDSTSEKDVPAIITPKQHPSSELLAQSASATREEQVYDCGEVMPQFPGGNRALLEFIKNNLHYPDLAMEYGVRGRVIMTGLIDSIGQALNFKPSRFRLSYDTLYMDRVPAGHQMALKQQIDSLLGEECIRVLNMMPRWTPGSLFGKTRSFRYVIPITLNVTEAERQTFLVQANDELQRHIAGLNGIEIPDSVRQARRDSLLRQREINMDSMLIVVNGTPIPLYKFKPNGVAPYLYKQHQLLSDSDINVEERIRREVYRPYGGNEERKRRCFEIYGERAKYGVVEVTTVPDTYSDDYISKHPNLKKERHLIEGYVYDEYNKPLADAWVHIRDRGIGAATDSTGHFVLWLPRNDIILRASLAGYVPVHINQPTDTTLTIRMRSATIIKNVKVPVKAADMNKYQGLDLDGKID